MQAYKIDVRNLTEQQKKDVQEAFFKLGYSWSGNSDEYTCLHCLTYFAYPSGSLTADGVNGNEEDDLVAYFNEHQNKQITYTELMQLANKGEHNMSNNFTKANLKDGMVVKLRGGCKFSESGDGFYLVLGDKYSNQMGHVTACNYYDDLTSDSYISFDIVEVFEVECASVLVINQMKLKSIWKRSEQTQQQKQLEELKAAQDQLMLQAKEIADKIDALQRNT